MAAHPTPAGPGRKRPPRPRARAWGWWFLLGLMVILSFGAGSLACLGVRQSGLLPEAVPTPKVVPRVAARPGRVNILLLGCDIGYQGRQRDDTAPVRSDTLVLASLDPAHQLIHVLSIPRDTRVTLPGRGEDKINAALAYGGPELARQTVAAFLGVPVDHFLRLKLDGMRAIVDALGGVEVDLDRPMRYRDQAAGLNISLPKGHLLLDGAKAQQYLRFRHDANGDIGRVQRQQIFLKALEAKLRQPATLLRLPQILDIVQKNVETDLFPTDLVRLASWAKSLPPGSVEMDMLPGRFSDARTFPSFWIPDATATHEVVQRMFVDAEAPSPASVSSIPVAQRQAARLTILNGTMHQGLGNEAARLLRQDGWTVWVVGNAAKRDLSATAVAPRHLAHPHVAALCQTLGVPGREAAQIDADPATDYTILLGEDFVDALRRARLNAGTLPVGR